MRGQRPGRDVERAVGLPGDIDRFGEQGEQSWLDRDRSFGRRAIDRAELARLAIDRQLGFELVDQIERRQGLLAVGVVLARIEKDLELAGHRPAAEVEQVAFALRRWERRRLAPQRVGGVGQGLGGRAALQKRAAAGFSGGGHPWIIVALRRPVGIGGRGSGAGNGRKRTTEQRSEDVGAGSVALHSAVAPLYNGGATAGGTEQGISESKAMQANSPLRKLIVGAAVVLLLAPIVWAAGGPKRARPPRWSKRDSDVFFGDAREKLNGPRPSAGSGGGSSAAPLASGGTPSATDSAPTPSDGGTFAWSNLISSDTIEGEVKALQKEISETVQTPAQFKGGGYKDGRRQFTELAALLGIIAEYDGEVRWKSSASGLRDLVGRAGQNCKVGTDASFNEAKLRKEDIEKLVRGESPQVEKGDPKPKWDKVAGRPPLMQRLEKCQQQAIGVWTADQGEFKKNAEKLEREAEILAALAELIQREGYEYADDDTYLGYAKQMRDAGKTVAEAARNKNYDGARKASGDISKACSSCHEGYRS